MAVEKRFIITSHPPSPSPRTTDDAAERLTRRHTNPSTPPPTVQRTAILRQDRRVSHGVGKRAQIASTTAAADAEVTAARALTQPDNRRVSVSAGSSTLADRPYVASLVCSSVRSSVRPSASTVSCVCPPHSVPVRSKYCSRRPIISTSARVWFFCSVVFFPVFVIRAVTLSLGTCIADETASSAFYVNKTASI